MRNKTIKSTSEILDVYAEAVLPWKRKVKKRRLRYAAVFAPILRFSDHDEFVVFDCECRDAEHLLMNIKFYLAQGLHPLAVKSKNGYLRDSKIDEVKAKVIKDFLEGGISYRKAMLEMEPSFLTIQASVNYEK